MMAEADSQCGALERSAPSGLHTPRPPLPLVRHLPLGQRRFISSGWCTLPPSPAQGGEAEAASARENVSSQPESSVDSLALCSKS